MQCRDMFCGVLLLKNKSRERTQKQNKRKQQRETKNFKLLHQLCDNRANGLSHSLAWTPHALRISCHLVEELAFVRVRN